MIVAHNNTKYKFFWGGEFSNWFKSDFTINGITYNCGEQGMMHQKALLFKDYEIADKILKTKNPADQKRLGREIKNFHQHLWNVSKYNLVKDVLREKYNQNPELKEYLLQHKDCEIIEASTVDRIWGIGFHESDALEHIDEWGENLLGNILTELANEL